MTVKPPALTRDEAASMITAILERVADDQLPTPNRIDRAPERDTYWFGSRGFCALSTKLAGEPICGEYRRNAVADIFEHEAMQRIETRLWAERQAVSA